MTTGEVLDRTFTLYRNNFLLFAGIGTVPALVLFGALLLLVPFSILFTGHGSLGSMNMITVVGIVSGYLIVVGIFYFAGYSLAMGATVHAVSQVHLGRPATIRDSYKAVRPYVWRILSIVIRVMIRSVGAFFLAYLAMVVVLMFMATTIRSLGPGSAVMGVVVGILAVGVFFAGMVFAVVIFCKYALAVPACVLEKLRIYASLKRSSFLAKGALFRIFLVVVLMSMIGGALSFAFQFPGAILGNFIGSVLGGILQLVGSFIGSALAFPIGTIALSLLYYDQRVRKEALDLQLMMESLAQPAPIQAPVAPTIG
jgi:hypothetical protein